MSSSFLNEVFSSSRTRFIYEEWVVVVEAGT
jgi:hypothetical protein